MKSAAVVAALFVGGASGGALAQEQQQQQQDELISTHDDWEIRCAAEGRCYMTQAIFNDTGGQVMVMNIIRLAEPRATDRGTIVAVADILTPLGVILPEGLRMKIDEGQTRVTQFDLCNPIGCISRAPLQEDLVTALKGGAGATFTVSVPNQSGVGERNMQLSLTGFTAAFDTLTPVSP